MFAATPPPPYTAVIFTNRRTAADPEGYDAMGERMEQLAAEQPGYLGIESVRGADGVGITISYWASEDDASAWRAVAEHRVAQQHGMDRTSGSPPASPRSTATATGSATTGRLGHRAGRRTFGPRCTS